MSNIFSMIDNLFLDNCYILNLNFLYIVEAWLYISRSYCTIQVPQRWIDSACSCSVIGLCLRPPSWFLSLCMKIENNHLCLTIDLGLFPVIADVCIREEWEMWTWLANDTSRMICFPLMTLICFEISVFTWKRITSAMQSCFFQIHCIQLVKRCLNECCLLVLVQAFVIFRIDYCNSILAELPAVTLHPLTTVLQLNPRWTASSHSSSADHRPPCCCWNFQKHLSLRSHHIRKLR